MSVIWSSQYFSIWMILHCRFLQDTSLSFSPGWKPAALNLLWTEWVMTFVRIQSFLNVELRCIFETCLIALLTRIRMVRKWSSPSVLWFSSSLPAWVFSAAVPLNQEKVGVGLAVHTHSTKIVLPPSTCEIFGAPTNCGALPGGFFLAAAEVKVSAGEPFRSYQGSFLCSEIRKFEGRAREFKRVFEVKVQGHLCRAKIKTFLGHLYCSKNENFSGSLI